MIERALIAVDVCVHAVILATDSSQIAFVCEEIGSRCGDIGLGWDADFEMPGLYLWTGTTHFTETNAYGDYEPDTHYRGTVRPVEPGEVAALYAMVPPVDLTAREEP